MISHEKISELLAPYGFETTESFSNAVRRYVELLLQWNRKISLTTVIDPIEIVKFHFGESLFALSSVPIREGQVADVGSGAGFPGLPLAMAKPDLHVTLIESNAKKAAFLSEVVRKLELLNVRVAHTRMEDLPANPLELDFIIARALGQRKKLLKWSYGRLSERGKIVLWLGQADASSLSRETHWRWAQAILIPGSKRRYLLVGSFRNR